jgi:hypothetical protein
VRLGLVLVREEEGVQEEVAKEAGAAGGSRIGVVHAMKWPVARHRKIGKWWRVAAGVVVVVSIWASGITSWPDELKGLRPATDQDELYRYLAQELEEPSICEKIPWTETLPGGFFLAPSYERSQCYAFIAGRTRNPWPCLKVRRLDALALLSDQTSRWSCLRDAWEGRDAGIAISSQSLVKFFMKLGYDPDTLDQEGITPPVVNPRDVYMQLSARPDLIPRIEAAIGAPTAAAGFAESADANGSYLADMAALLTKNPQWCARISDHAQLPGEKARFRDWCFFTLANNTKNDSLCRRIPLPQDGTDPRLSLRANCDRQANSGSPTGQYGPEVPPDEGIRSVMALLNYPIPKAKDLPVDTINAAFGRFMDELNRQTDAQHIAARQRFVRKVIGVEREPG